MNWPNAMIAKISSLRPSLSEAGPGGEAGGGGCGGHRSLRSGVPSLNIMSII